MNKLKNLIMMDNQGVDDGNDADYPPYLCFQSLESDFSVCLGGDFHDHTCQYSFNRKDWFDLPARTYTPTIGILQKVYFRSNLTTVPMDATNPNGVKSIGKFSTTKKCRLSGNPTSMLHGMDWTLDNFNTSASNYGLAYLFQNSKSVSVSKDFFDFTSVSARACWNMFYFNEYLKGDIYITKAAGTSSSGSAGVFSGAFYRCKLDSVFIETDESAWQTYTNTFASSLIKSLNLPATYIYPGMYQSTCENCTYLEKVFINGRNLNVSSTVETYTDYLTKAFFNCPKLSEVTYLVTNPFDKRYTNNWLTGVAEDGTIILNKFITWNPKDYKNGNIDNIEGSATLGETITWGIPKNWEVKYCDPVTLEVKDRREEFIEYGDYMTLEYIQTNGKQYIDSQIILNVNSRIEVDARPTTSTSTTAYLLCGNSYDTNNRITINPTNVYNGTSRFNGAKFEGNLYREGRHTWATDRYGLYIDGKKVGEWDTAPSEIRHTTSFYILADRISTGTGVQLMALTGARIYGLKVYENGRLVADMVPVLSVSQNRPGLYDTVNKRFLTNMGSGEFTYR